MIYTIYVNGQSVFQSTDALTTRPTTVFNAATGGGIYFYIDELRISDIARYTEDFEPPTKPYSVAVPTGNFVIRNKTKLVHKSDIGIANGVASLDANAKVPVVQIPDLSSTYATINSLATVATSGMYSDLTGTPGVATSDTLGLVKPDGNTITVTENGTISAEVNIPITSLPSESGNISLQSNTVYKLSINGATTFAPQTPADTTIHNQIKVFLSVSGTPTINWGTSNYFNKTAIEIKEGNYVVYFDYDPNLSAWTVGAMTVGGAE